MKKIDYIESLAWEKMNGLLPVITQDIDTKEVLMQAFINHEALKLSIETGIAHYYSRSKDRIWKKGETSGNIQKILKILVDCDGDCLLYLVKQLGVACHTGKYTCFYRTIFEDK
ncbi:MAG: phosphoribosyl-AMP cyclohydrolase [Calditerrivibrio sp.]|nr:phosphoribosyl-AMP cyclohydrolase [Calditerrivibrio sp.]